MPCTEQSAILLLTLSVLYTYPYRLSKYYTIYPDDFSEYRMFPRRNRIAFPSRSDYNNKSPAVWPSVR